MEFGASEVSTSAGDVAQTVRFVHFLDGRIKDFPIETGESVPDDDAAKSPQPGA